MDVSAIRRRQSMPTTAPAPELDTRFSSPNATPTAWPEARSQLEDAEVYWITTVRPDGRPHVTPLIAVWSGDAMYFCTGPSERKARNLERNRHCILTTGRNSLAEGLDVVVEGDAERVIDDAHLRRLADAYEAKYGEDWRFDVQDGEFRHSSGEGVAFVFEVAPRKAFGFRKGDEFSQTRWRFDA
jgi:general stress protein 26